MSLYPCWRWFGPSDNISLDDIRMTGAKGIVSSLYDIPIGMSWNYDDIMDLKYEIESKGFDWYVVESIPVHESIKYGGDDRDRYIDNFILTMRNLSKAGINIICYNFMPVVDWTRTNLMYKYFDGSFCLRFDIIEFIIFDIFILKRDNSDKDYTSEQIELAKSKFISMDEKDKETLKKNILKGLPGCMVESYDIEDFRNQLEKYKKITNNIFRDNLKYFLSKIVPVAIELDLYLGIHPDDPPISLFGLPRIVSNIEDLKYICECYNDNHNGITLCVGSLASRIDNNLSEIVDKLLNKINFVHLRNVIKDKDNIMYNSFIESDHLEGDVDMNQIIEKILKNEKVFALPFRPDHGLLIFNERENKYIKPGYSLLGRFKGMSQLLGIIYSKKDSII